MITSSSTQPSTIRAESIGFAFVKSGYEDITDELLTDFDEFGLEPLHVHPVVLTVDTIDYIYRDSREQHFYTDMRQHLALHAVIALTMFHPTDNAQLRLQNLKTGADGYTNLRNKYRKPRTWLDSTELALWDQGKHRNQYETTVALTQENVFHAADSTEEALQSIWRLRQSVPDFYSPTNMRDMRLAGVAELLTKLDA